MTMNASTASNDLSQFQGLFFWGFLLSSAP